MNLDRVAAIGANFSDKGLLSLDERYWTKDMNVAAIGVFSLNSKFINLV